MTASIAPRLAGNALVSTESAERAWFLRGSAWQDSTWIFAPTNKLEEEHPVRIRWDFTLPHGRCFTDPRYASLLESAKKLLALIRTRSLSSGLAQRARTVDGYFSYLRELLRWMDQEGFGRFADLDATALLQFQRSIRNRRGVRSSTLASTTVQKYLYLLTYLYRFRDELGDGLRVDPFPGQSPGMVAGVRDDEGRRWPSTPDVVAVALIQGAIALLANCATDILRAREIYATAIAAAQRRGYGEDACANGAARALRQVTTCTPRGPQTIGSVADFAKLVDMLYAACFVVISYLVGPRVSEILHLEAGCVGSRSANGSGGDVGLAVIVGAIFKREADYYGRHHEWVAPQPAIQAIAVLEALATPHREATGRKELWLRTRGRAFGAIEWQHECPGPIQIPDTRYVTHLLNRFGAWLGLPDHDGGPWRLSTHQGRKTFVRFAALRDRSALFALAQHLGHRERAITDQGYCGTDYALNREIDAQILEQSVSAWEHMLAAPGLGGRAGAEIIAKRPRFRGTRIKQDLKSYARMLVEAGLVLGVCDWGFCVYREEHSACLGNAVGPNPMRREPSTCARCRNFAVSTQHRVYWVEQVRRHEALLNEPALPLQTLRIARERMTEARALIRSIDAKAKGDRHGSSATR
jgi:integrase